MDYIITLAVLGQHIVERRLTEGSTILGRSDQADVTIKDASISEQHARLIVTPDSVWIEDLNSSNGTQVNGAPVIEPMRLDATALVSIGDSVFRVSPVVADALPPSLEPATPTKAPTPPAPQRVPEAPKLSPMEIALRKRRVAVKHQIHDHLIQRLELKRLTASGVTTAELEQRVRDILKEIVDNIVSKGNLPADIDPIEIQNELFNESMRLGPIEAFLDDDSITEIMINGPDRVYVESNGKLTLTNQTFMDDESVVAVIERIVAPLGRRIDESQPYVDARLADGSRVNAIIAPLSLIGPCITIRKFAKRVLTVQDFINYGTWTQSAADFLSICVRMRKNIIVSGGTGSGKTTLLNLLSSFIPSTERILTIEDAAELRLNQPHVVRLESRPANIEGRGAVTIRDLVRNALRMRPDRIIVGECRGGETLDMLQAMNTGHDGSLTTVHANSPRDVISRMETMVLMSGMDLPSRAIREQIASAVDIIIQESRMSDGSRKVVAISEVVGQEGNQIVMQDLFTFEQTGLSESGKIIGQFKPTGGVPTFFDQLRARGIELDAAIFNPDGEALS